MLNGMPQEGNTCSLYLFISVDILKIFVIEIMSLLQTHHVTFQIFHDCSFLVGSQGRQWVLALVISRKDSKAPPIRPFLSAALETTTTDHAIFERHQRNKEKLEEIQR